MSDLIEHTTLEDKECPATGVSLWIPHELEESPNVRRLDFELRRQWGIPPSNTQLTAVLAGIFHREHRKLYLKVVSVERLEVGTKSR